MGELLDVGRALRAAIPFGLIAAALTCAGTARASATGCRPTWEAQPRNVGSGTNQLNAVSAVSDCDVWAVGTRLKVNTRTDQALIEHWNGKAWKVFPSANPGDSNGTQLSGVAATSSSNAWAVGDYFNGASDQTLIEHWNGTAWKVQPSPDPGGS